MFVTDQRAHRGDRADDGGENARDHLLFGQHHRGVAEAAGRVARADDAVPLRDRGELLPEKLHVPHAEHTLRKNHLAEIALHQRLVVQLLAADRFDAEQLGARLGRTLEEFQHPVPMLARTHDRRPRKLAIVVRRHPQHRRQAVLPARIVHPGEQHLRDLEAESRGRRHRRHCFEFDHDARRLEFGGAAQRIGDDFAIVADDDRHGRRRHFHRRQREIQLRINQPAADAQTVAGDDRLRRMPEVQVVGMRNGKLTKFHSVWFLMSWFPPGTRSA